MFAHRIPLFKLFGFQVWIDWSWILIAVFFAWSLRESVFPDLVAKQSPGVYWSMGILGALGLFLSIVAHEFSHSMVARRLGLQMSGITLFIFGGVAEMSEEPAKPSVEFWMAIAGPIMSFVVGGISFVVCLLFDRSHLAIPAALFNYLAQINVLLGCFNLIPAFPLDGGRVLRSILWHFKGDIARSTKVASVIGSGFAILLIVLGLSEFLSGAFIDGVWLFLIGSFLRNASENSYRQVVISKALEGETVRRFMNPRPVVVPAHITIRELLQTYVSHNYHKSYPVSEETEVVGIVNVDQIKDVLEDDREYRTVGQIAEPPSSQNTVSADEDAIKAMEMMQRNRRTLLLVIDNGVLEGIVTLRDVAGLLTVKLQFEQKAGKAEVIPPPVIRR